MNYVPHDVVREDRTDGSILLRSRVPLGPVARNTGEWLHAWAEKAPTRVFLAERSGAGWRELSYGELLQQVRAVAQSLLARGLGPETPVAIISSACPTPTMRGSRWVPPAPGTMPSFTSGSPTFADGTATR